MEDILGNILRATPSFRGKWRLQRIWENLLSVNDRRLARLPDGSTVDVEMHIPYERMVWLQAEEWRELQFLQHRLRENDTFVDVGANIGLWTLVAATAVGISGKVFSFEPNPATFRKLRANVQRNCQAHVVTAFQQAVTKTNGSVSFSCSEQHNISAISENPKDSNVISVEGVCLDSALSGVKVTGMKLDTEGHELASLEGAFRIIDNFSPWLIIEFNTTLLESPTLADWPVYHFLSSLGYKPFIYNGPQEINKITDSFSISGYCNIMFERGANHGLQ